MRFIVLILALASPLAVAADSPVPPWRSLSNIFLWREYQNAGAEPVSWGQTGLTISNQTSNLPVFRDLMTKEEYGDFELELEYTYNVGDTVGVIYRATTEYERPFLSGPEFEIGDDWNATPQSPRPGSGGVRGLYPGALKLAQGPNNWNALRIVARGGHVEQWLNGTKVVEYEIGGNDWNARVNKSRFVKFPGYGRAAKGHIAIQGSGETSALTGALRLRNIRIRSYDGNQPERYVFEDPSIVATSYKASSGESYTYWLCITDPQGPDNVSYLTDELTNLVDTPKAEMESAWAAHAKKDLYKNDHAVKATCKIIGAAHLRVLYMHDSQVLQDSENGIKDVPVSWVYQPPAKPQVAQTLAPGTNKSGANLPTAPPPAAKPQIAGAHGEDAKIEQQKDGSYLLKYTAIEPGHPERHLEYRVAAATLKLPTAMPGQQPLIKDTWIWVGTGTDAGKAMMFKLEENAIVRWTPINPMVAKIYLP